AAPPTARRRAATTRSRALTPFTRLTLGTRGPDVQALQQRLAERGFSPGAADGHFGHGTEAAVRAFQLSSGLLADGVAGPRTLAALGLANDAQLPSALPKFTVQVVAAMCPGAPLGNIKTYLPALIQALEEHGLVDKPMLLMAVATICAETGRFAPLDEYRSRYNTSPSARAPYFDLYDNRADLGNRGPNDGSDFKGRGFIQLTGRANYERYGKALGLGDRLLREPEFANDPLIAARVLARFLKDRELKIKRALLEGNFPQARKYVNGGTHGIVDFTRSYLAGEPLLA
ncbi:MAG: peptidoglycan-binding protein, partial [Burkholderiaceae bacterium]